MFQRMYSVRLMLWERLYARVRKQEGVTSKGVAVYLLGDSPCSRSLHAPMLTPHLVRRLSRTFLARCARAPWPALATAATTTWTSPAARVSGEKNVGLVIPIFAIRAEQQIQ